MSVLLAVIAVLVLLVLPVVLPLLAARDLKRQGHVVLPALLVLFAGFVVLSWVSCFLTSTGTSPTARFETVAPPKIATPPANGEQPPKED